MIFGSNKVAQVAIVVKDIETTKQKYAEFFGIEVPATITSGEYEITKAEYKGQPAPRISCKMAFFNAGNLTIELIEPNGEPSTWQDFLDEKGEGLHHIAFQVENTDKAIENAKSMGMIVQQRGKYGDASGEYSYLESSDLKIIIETLQSY